jgi:4-hydroxy-3-polyprenylbenzoate decarboxylase
MRYIDLRDWKEVIWAITTRVDPLRDTTLVDRTPIDYLDFASPIANGAARLRCQKRSKPGSTVCGASSASADRVGARAVQPLR